MTTYLYAQVDRNVAKLVDPRDGKAYRAVRIGNLIWLAENLNYEAKGSLCYNENTYNCTKYGRLYPAVSAERICPVGWRLPTRQDWNALVQVAGDSSVAEKKLKATAGWIKSSNGTNELGFSALPGGYCYDDTVMGSDEDGELNFNGIGEKGFWWSAGEEEIGVVALDNTLKFFEFEVYSCEAQGLFYSVRCVKESR